MEAKGQVQCDKCNWSGEVTDLEEIKAWHHKMCPKCGECEIVNDEDMKYYHALVMLQGLSDVIDVQRENRVRVFANTAPLRHGGEFMEVEREA